MARPKKVGLEYFSLDVKMDDEVELIKGKHGMEGFGVLISMFQTIYGDKGYYYSWTEREQILFSNKVSVDRNLVTTIINDCIKWDIFSKEMYENHQILTSKRIQDQYISATYKRTEVKIREEYLLIEKNDRENITYIGVSDNGNQETTEDNDDINSQSKVKYKDSKKNNNVRNVSTKDTKQHNRDTGSNETDEKKEDGELYPNFHPKYSEILDYAKQKIVVNALSREYLINEDLQKHSPEVLKKAIDLAVMQQKSKDNYKRGDPKNGVDIGSWKYIQCFIEEAKEVLEGGKPNGGNSRDDSEDDGEGGKDEGARITKKAFELMGFEEE